MYQLLDEKPEAEVSEVILTKNWLFSWVRCLCWLYDAAAVVGTASARRCLLHLSVSCNYVRWYVDK